MLKCVLFLTFLFLASSAEDGDDSSDDVKSEHESEDSSSTDAKGEHKGEDSSSADAKDEHKGEDSSSTDAKGEHKGEDSSSTDAKGEHKDEDSSSTDAKGEHKDEDSSSTDAKGKHKGGGGGSEDVIGELEGFGCQSIEKFMDLLKLVGTEARKLYKPRFGILYKGLKEVRAKDIKECVDKCGNNEKCFVLSWTEDKKCHLQQDGNGVLKRSNFEPKENALTLLGKTKHLQRFRKLGGKGDYDEKSDDDDEEEARFKDGFGCKNSLKCLDLVRRSGFENKLWWIMYGYRYKKSKKVSSKDVKECLNKCKNSDKCFVVSWTKDQKCFVQDDGKTDLKPDNFEKDKDTLTFFGRVNKLLRLRKFGNQYDYDEEPEYDDDGFTSGRGGANGDADLESELAPGDSPFGEIS